METIVKDGKLYKLVPVKEEKKTMALFTLGMASVGSWNGKWSGSNRVYVKSCKAFNRGKALYPNLKEGVFFHMWDDGWNASVNVKFVTPTEARKAMKRSDGFCGYEWMIDDLKQFGKINQR